MRHRRGPFLLGPIFAVQGWRDSPFDLYPAGGRYMWRELERLSAQEGLGWRRPRGFPRNRLLAARAALLGETEGWGIAFSKAVFAANFAGDREIAAPEVLGGLLRALGLDSEDILARAQSPANKEALRQRNAAAERLGIFGAPTFQVEEEIFWGHDRLDQALARTRR